MKSAMIAFFLMVSHSSFAAIPAEISEHHCVPASIDSIHSLFTQYDQYSKMPGATYSMGLAGVNVDLIQMIKSQAKPLSRSGKDSDTLVWIVLQPALVTEAAFYPRFLLDCKVTWNGNSNFSQICALQKEKQHFGLDDLRMDVKVVAQDASCGKNQSGIQINVKIVSNPKEVEQIKRATLGPAGMLAPLISALFDEDTFFQNYFHFIYNEWIKTL